MNDKPRQMPCAATSLGKIVSLESVFVCLPLSVCLCLYLSLPLSVCSLSPPPPPPPPPSLACDKVPQSSKNMREVSIQLQVERLVQTVSHCVNFPQVANQEVSLSVIHAQSLALLACCVLTCQEVGAQVFFN